MKLFPLHLFWRILKKIFLNYPGRKEGLSINCNYFKRVKLDMED